MLEFIRRKFDYEYWANQRVLRSLSEASPRDEGADRLLGHVLIAHQFWFCRLRGDAPPSSDDMFPLRTPDVLASEVEKLRTMWAGYLAGLDESRLSDVVAYRTIKGAPFESSVLDILTHVLNHSTYHRGQIAARLRAVGANPLPTDYIIFARGG